MRCQVKQDRERDGEGEPQIPRVSVGIYANHQVVADDAVVKIRPAAFGCEEGANYARYYDQARKKRERKLEETDKRGTVETPSTNLRGEHGSYGRDGEQQARLHRGTRADAEEESTREGAQQGQPTCEQDSQGAKPEGSPEVVRPVFQRGEEPPWQQGDEDGGPEAYAPGIESAPEMPYGPECHKPERHHGKAHVGQDVGTFAQRGDERREEDVEEGGVVVEEVAVLQHPLRPAPSGVEVLRFVAVVAEAEDVEAAQEEGS